MQCVTKSPAYDALALGRIGYKHTTRKVLNVMDKHEWNQRVRDSEAHRRAGGRRHYNEMRRLKYLVLREHFWEMIRDVPASALFLRLRKLGTPMPRIAQALGVHRSTCWRWFWQGMREAQRSREVEAAQARAALEQVASHLSQRRREQAAAQPRDDQGRFVGEANEDEQKEGAEG